MLAVILAGGLGTRMRSRVPKVLHRLGGLPLLEYPIRLALGAGAQRVVVVVGRVTPAVVHYLRQAHPAVRTATQAFPRGSGDAARAALPLLKGQPGPVLILCGDVPLVRPQTLARLLRARRKARLAIVTSRPPDPFGYGRIIRRGGRVVDVVEEADADAAQRRIDEVNAGIYLAEARWLARALPRLRRRRGSEVYLTDLIAMAAAEGVVPTVEAEPDEMIGVNNRVQLARAEAVLRSRTIAALAMSGVTVRHPESTFVDASARVGRDTEIHPCVQIRGTTVIGRRCVIESGCIITDSRIEDEAHLLPYSVVEGSRVGRRARVGPFARLRPLSDLGAGAHVGNFVETKKARLGAGAKANHHAYLGDAEIGAGCNVGAGTITCNYDGKTKHVTTLERGVFIGSDTQLVAPVRVGKGAYVGAGSTITREVPPGALALSRAPQTNIEGWVKRQAEKARKKAAEQRER